MTIGKFHQIVTKRNQIYFLVNCKYFLFSNFFLYNALFLSKNQKP
ncbi:hypothetical protein TSAR_009343 [Trichomalopsis sarcophagae]|uniref:Uncharacterized protein n=1 Tax=Trichomalopsis sarcophagae TaxID=543379 RepID=A0A232ENS5_9HYME|nr:hypothetical protein TSAR_009343 [Trichomalopsis sarcophagae]